VPCPQGVKCKAKESRTEDSRAAGETKTRESKNAPVDKHCERRSRGRQATKNKEMHALRGGARGRGEAKGKRKQENYKQAGAKIQTEGEGMAGEGQ